MGVLFLPVSGYRIISRNSHNQQVLEERHLCPDFPFSGHFSEFKSVSICRSSCHLFPAFGFRFLHGKQHGHSHGATPWLKSLLVSSWKGTSLTFTAEGVDVESGDLHQLPNDLIFGVKSSTKKTKTQLKGRRQNSVYVRDGFQYKTDLLVPWCYSGKKKIMILWSRGGREKPLRVRFQMGWKIRSERNECGFLDT